MTFIEGGIVLDSSGNPTSNGYVKCKSKHLTTFSAGTEFSEFVNPVV